NRVCDLAEMPPVELPASRECDARLRCPGVNRRPPGVSRAVPAIHDSRDMPPRFRTGHLVAAMRSPRIDGRNFEASDSNPLSQHVFPRIRAQVRSRASESTLGWW